MLFFRKKHEETDSKMLEQIKKETPPEPPALYAQQSQEIQPQGTQEQLSQEQVAKLPLFMKISDYDSIVQELNTIVTSLLEMGEALSKMRQHEYEAAEETRKLNHLLAVTQNQTRILLSRMPETGKLRDIISEKKKQKAQKAAKKIAQAQPTTGETAPDEPHPLSIPLPSQKSIIKKTTQPQLQKTI